MSRTLDETLAWAGDGAAHLRGLMTRMGEDAFAAPSALPGWSRAHVLCHIARNADGMINLLAWARTGVPTPAYPSRESRDAGIESGVHRAPAEIRDDVVDSSDRLARAVRAMSEKAWAARVKNVQGVDIAATDIPWIRAREMWIHSVDLDVGGSFSDFPPPMLAELIGDVVRTVGVASECPSLRLVATDQDRTWPLGPDDGAERGPECDVLGTAAGLGAWLMGRSKGRDLRTGAGTRPPAVLPRWL